MDNNNSNHDPYDRKLGALKGLPDCIEVRPATARVTEPLLGTTQTYILHTVRQKDRGDHIFLEMVSRDGSIRIALPPQVADIIARQRESLTARSRSKAAKQAANDRKAAGIIPFQKVAGGQK